MPSPEILPVNFTISEAAKRAAEDIRAEYDATWPDNPAAVLFVGWGITVPETGPRSENVVLGYYQQSDLAAVEHGIQETSGVKLVFFITDEYHAKFEGRALDYTRDRGFFLRGQ
ncbi:MAG TPA: hypothetical protein VFB31_01420 [Pseudolabrys sp.]|nr:hypothetical protein [Pseudolabrys sp.]